MKRNGLRAFGLAAVVALAACSGGLTGRSYLPAPEQPAGAVLSQYELQVLQAPRHRACADAAVPGEFACHAILGDYRMRDDAQPDNSCRGVPGCYGPPELQAAYGLTQLSRERGKGVTVAIVDAFGYPTAAADLAKYRKLYGLPPCGQGCLSILNQNGQTSPLPPPNGQWDGEQALDLDMVSAICPNCKIALVEAQSGNGLVQADQLALKLADIVSNSWGGPEFAPSYTLYDSHPGKVLTFSSGDSGAGAQQPCTFQGVICVGGTSLVERSGKRVSEVVWDDLTKNFCSTGPCATGSGCSAKVAKPSWQTDRGCAMRSEADVSAVADPFTGVVVALDGAFYAGNGGTSASTPMIAAMYALAGNASIATPRSLWAKGGSAAFHDIVAGTNENQAAGTFMCPASYAYICVARPGYDGPTGWGTPNGLSGL